MLALLSGTTTKSAFSGLTIIKQTLKQRKASCWGWPSLTTTEGVLLGKTPSVVHDGQPQQDAFRRCNKFNDGPPQTKRFSLFFELVQWVSDAQTSTCCFRREEVGELALLVFLPFSARNSMILNGFGLKLLNTTENFMSVDKIASRLRSRRIRKLLAPSWPACSAESIAGLRS